MYETYQCAFYCFILFFFLFRISKYQPKFETRFSFVGCERKEYWRRNTVVVRFRVDFPELQCSNSVFSSRTNLCKINEFGFEINWFGQIHPTMRKPKATKIHMSSNWIFLPEKKDKSQTITQIMLCNCGSNSYISTKQKILQEIKMTIGEMANPTFNQIVVQFGFSCFTG